MGAMVRGLHKSATVKYEDGGQMYGAILSIMALQALPRDVPVHGE